MITHACSALTVGSLLEKGGHYVTMHYHSPVEKLKGLGTKPCMSHHFVHVLTNKSYISNLIKTRLTILHIEFTCI